MDKDKYYSIVFNNEQLLFLAGSKYGIDRMKILVALIESAVTEDTTIKLKGFATTLSVGQVLMSEVEMSNRFGYDKKTISRVLDKMARLGIISSTQNNRTSVHILHCVSAWYVDNKLIRNPHYISMEQRHKDYLASGSSKHDVLDKVSEHSDKEGTSKSIHQDSDNLPTCQTETVQQVNGTGHSNSLFPKFDESFVSDDKDISVLKHTGSADIAPTNESNAEGSADYVSAKHSQIVGNIPNKQNDLESTDGIQAMTEAVES